MSRRPQIPELAAIEVAGMTRGSFILRGALAAGAVYGAGAVTPFVERALAQTSAGDIAILQFALTLESLESAFYAAALKTPKLTAASKKLATEFSAHEKAHADALTTTIQTLNAKPGPAPAGKFAVRDDATFLKVGIALEEAGVSAYNGAAPRIISPDLLATAGAIVQVEARHAAALRETAGQDPSPAAFDSPSTTAQADAALKAFGGP
jgi:rubrerythrin